MGNKNATPVVLEEKDVAILSKTSGFDEHQVKEAFYAFKEKQPNGKIKIKEFCKMIDKSMPKKDARYMKKNVLRINDAFDKSDYTDFSEIMALAMPKRNTNNMKKHLFRMYDSNNDGSIDFVELMLFFYIMSEGTAEEVLEKIFRVFDVNGDGTITKEEVEALIKDMYDMIKAKNPEIQSQTSLVESVFAEMDADGDGKVTPNEFITACLSQEQMSKMLVLKVIDIFTRKN